MASAFFICWPLLPLGGGGGGVVGREILDIQHFIFD